MNQQELQSILAELGLDPSDTQLQKLLERLIAEKPNVQIDEQFKLRLRQQLQQKIAGQAANDSDSTINIFTKFMNKLMIPALVVVVLLIAGGVWYTNQNPGLINVGGNQLLSSEYSVDPVAANSFGDLSKVAINTNGERNQSGGGTAAFGLGAGGDAAMAEDQKMIAPGSGGGSDVSILPVPGTNYEFAYDGDLPELAASQDVLKRVKPQQNPSLVSRIISFFSFGLIDLGKFTDTKIQNFSFVEDKDYGLGVNIDLNYGNVSLYQNWEKWPQPEYVCDNNYCGAVPRITKEDMPSEAEAVSIANQFVTDYGVSLEGYGNPFLYEQYAWIAAYERSEDKDRFYFPENVMVMYPLTLEGQTVYDEGGNPAGMVVNIDVRTRKVNNLYGLDSKQFQKSSYVGETDTKRIDEIVKRGGYNNGWYWGGSDSEKKRTVKLGTPTVELVRMWYSPNPNQPGDELYVPSLVFPILDAPEEMMWRKNVVVPLVKDILDNENRGGQPIPFNEPVSEPSEEPIPVEPDGGIGDTPVSTEPAEPTILPAIPTS